MPKKYILGLLILLFTQVCFHIYFIKPAVTIQALKKPSNQAFYLLPVFSDHIVSAKLLILWLQSFDNQPGVSLSFNDLNYNTLSQWLTLIQNLDADSHYPLLVASRVYAVIKDPDKKKIMIEFVKREYLKNPDARWRWMAQLVYIAKYELEDLDLALEIATLLRENTSYDAAPAWATQMELFILEDMNEIESAKILIGGFLESGKITDDHEIRFLLNRLKELEAKKKN